MSVWTTDALVDGLAGGVDARSGHRVVHPGLRGADADHLPDRLLRRDVGPQPHAHVRGADRPGRHRDAPGPTAARCVGPDDPQHGDPVARAGPGCGVAGAVARPAERSRCAVVPAVDGRVGRDRGVGPHAAGRRQVLAARRAVVLGGPQPDRCRRPGGSDRRGGRDRRRAAGGGRAVEVRHRRRWRLSRRRWRRWWRRGQLDRRRRQWRRWRRSGWCGVGGGDRTRPVRDLECRRRLGRGRQLGWLRQRRSAAAISGRRRAGRVRGQPLRRPRRLRHAVRASTTSAVASSVSSLLERGAHE